MHTHTIKDNIHYLVFTDNNTARLAYEELNLYVLNLVKKLNGKVIEISIQSHSGETRNNLQLILNNFFNNQKNSFQSKRNKLIKKNKENKKQIDMEIKFLNSFIYLDVNKMK